MNTEKIVGNTLSSSPLSDGPVFSTPEETQKSSHALVSIFLGITVLFAVGLGGVLLGKNLYAPKPASIVPIVTPTQAPITTPTSVTTGNWKTYTNDHLQFSFDYPQKWLIKTTEGDEKKQMIIKVRLFEEATNSQVELEIYKDSLVFGKTVEAYLSYLKKLSEDRDGAQVTVSSKSKIVGSNINGFYIEIGGIDVGKDVAFDNKGYLYIFRLPIMRMRPEEQTESEKLLDQILSTFKFTD